MEKQLTHCCTNCGNSISVHEQFCNAGCRDRFNKKSENDYETEYFFYNDDFYYEISDLIHHIEENECEINELPNDYKIECFKSELQPMVKFDAQWIAEKIDEERFPEDYDDKLYSKLISSLNECIDFEKLNSMIPNMYYETRNKFYLTKEIILNHM